MGRRKIFHVITTIERGGAENAIATLAKVQVQNGYEVTLIPLKGLPELQADLEQNGIRVFSSLLDKTLLQQIRTLRRIVAQDAIIHAHLPRAEIFCRIAFGKGRTIYTRHNSEKFFPAAPRYLSSLLSRWVSKGSNLIAISNAVLAFLNDNNEIHRSCTSSVIHYGYERRSIRRGNTLQSSKKNDVFRIGTVSRLVPQKNLPLLLRLTSHLLSVGQEIETTIVGSGPLEVELQAMVVDLNVQERVHFLGRKSKIMNYLETLDLFVLTSKYEGFGLALLEAMDANLPVVAPDNSAIPEVLGPDHPGLFISGSLTSLSDRVSKFIESEQLRSFTCDLQNSRLDYFSVSRYVENHEQVYAKLRFPQKSS